MVAAAQSSSAGADEACSTWLSLLPACVVVNAVNTVHRIEARRGRARVLGITTVDQLDVLTTQMARSATYDTPQHGWTVRASATPRRG